MGSDISSLHFSSEQSHGCTLDSVDVSKVTRICDNLHDHHMTKRPAGKAKDRDPNLCGNEGSRRRKEL